MSTPGRHIKSYEPVQSLIHETFMKILLNFLKESTQTGGKGEKTSIWATGGRESGNGLATFSSVAGAASLGAPSEGGAWSQGSSAFIINSYFPKNEGEGGSRKNKEMSDPGGGDRA